MRDRDLPRVKLNQIERRLAAIFFGAAIAADSRDDKAVARYPKTVFASNRLANRLEFFAMEFNQLIAALAVQMIVLGVAVIVLVNAPTAQAHRPQQAGIHQFVERTVNSRSADSLPVNLSAAENQLVGIEMVVPLENVIDKLQPLLRNPFALALQILHKPVARRRGDFDRFQSKFASHINETLAATRGGESDVQYYTAAHPEQQPRRKYHLRPIDVAFMGGSGYTP